MKKQKKVKKEEDFLLEVLFEIEELSSMLSDATRRLENLEDKINNFFDDIGE